MTLNLGPRGHLSSSDAHAGFCVNWKAGEVVQNGSHLFISVRFVFLLAWGRTQKWRPNCPNFTSMHSSSSRAGTGRQRPRLSAFAWSGLSPVCPVPVVVFHHRTAKPSGSVEVRFHLIVFFDFEVGPGTGVASIESRGVHKQSDAALSALFKRLQQFAVRPL